MVDNHYAPWGGKETAALVGGDDTADAAAKDQNGRVRHESSGSGDDPPPRPV